jgi:hypothetical protein
VYDQAKGLIGCSCRGSLAYDRLQDFGNYYQSPDESGLEDIWTPTPDALAAHAYEMWSQPSVELTRQMWWGSLTMYYGGPRTLATRRIMEDLSHLLVRVALLFFYLAEIFSAKFPNLQFLYCRVPCLLHSILEDVPLTLVFPPRINVPLFFSTFHHPSQWEHVQPSLVLAMLALSTLFQSSEIGFGQEGRLKACEFPSMYVSMPNVEPNTYSGVTRSCAKSL